jgi:UDP-N-acetylmuramyl pentapeptide synthase
MNVTALTSSGIGRCLRNRHPAKIVRFCNDTRTLSPGECFVAFVTGKRDGHAFLRDAMERRASCAIVSRPDPTVDLPQFICPDTQGAIESIARLFRSAFTGTTVAVTGSFGKTTTKDILKLLFGIENNATLGSQNGQIGVPFTLALLQNSERFAAVEVGVDALGTMGKLADLVRPDVAIVTGIDKVHLPSMVDGPSIAAEKCGLITGALARKGRGIFLDDCLGFDAFKKLQNLCTVVSAGGDEFGYGMDIVDGRFEVTVTYEGRAHRFAMPPSMGRGGAKDFVLACTCALGCGIGADTIREKISQWRPSRWRGEIVEAGGRTFFADCFNANPVALADSLENFDRLFPHGGRLFVVGLFTEEGLGDGAPQENALLCGGLPIRPGDRVILLGDGAERFIDRIECPDRSAFPTATAALAAVKDFRGVVYLKGHRSYGLENLIG